MRVSAVYDKASKHVHWVLGYNRDGGRISVPLGCGIQAEVTAPDDVRPLEEITCPTCQVEYAAAALKVDTRGCFFCDGLGVAPGGPQGNNQDRVCPMCLGTGRTDIAGMGG